MVDIVIKRPTSTYRRGHMKAGQKRIRREQNAEYAESSLDPWLDECRNAAYVPGYGTWTTAQVHVLAKGQSHVDFSDEEVLDRMPNGNWYPGAHPSGAQTWAQQLLAYPRTADNIPSWMWNIFRAEGVTPPIYNPEFKSVDWKNRRRPVTDRGTDFSVEPTIIDPSLESGVLSRIGKKLFGSRS
ncbi:hypothetical protein [Paenarthrobacter sp. NPDC090522]|uniref:hypothetical protein n=1 Tax=Paenarthrobacter sp. NPDC090522 TaxID=3364383 RepID=UPI0037F88552